jgi:hypothetical protein
MEAVINQRGAPRLDRRLFDIWQLAVNNDELITRHIINISPTGLSFKAPARVKFALGQFLKVAIRLTAEKSYDCEARVVWVKDGQYGVHFTFCPLSYDAFVMKTIHEQDIAAHADELAQISNRKGLLKTLRIESRDKQKKAILLSTLDLILVGVFTMAFIVVAVNHEQKTSSYSLEKVITKNLERFFSKKSN